MELAEIQLSNNEFGPFVYTRAAITNQYNLSLIKRIGFLCGWEDNCEPCGK